MTHQVIGSTQQPACCPAQLLCFARYTHTCRHVFSLSRQQALAQALPAALTHLSLAGNELHTLEGLAHPRLTWLDVSGNEIEVQ